MFIPIQPYELPVPLSHPTARYAVPTLVDLLQRRPPEVLQAMNRRSGLLAQNPCPLVERSQDSIRGSGLNSLINEFIKSDNHLWRRYGRALYDSQQTEAENPIVLPLLTGMPPLSELETYSKECGQIFDEIFCDIVRTLSPSQESPFEKAVYDSGQWPRLILKDILGLLSETSTCLLRSEWRRSIVILAHSLICYQQAWRLVRHRNLGAQEDFAKEFRNEVHSFQDEKYHEWLLIQIEGNFAVRSLQRQVAKEMMSPSSAENTLLQFNMGEGKSSVIVPIVASALADGKMLTRVVVLKPLAHQMFDLLVKRLTGLANRRIFYLPFSRDVEAQTASEEFQPLLELCRQKRGILVAQPEHLLSFKLMGIDMAIRMEAESKDISESLLASQRWLQTNSRDILDESDEILSVKYQLVYTSGVQEPIEHHPDRWHWIQEILHCAGKQASSLQKENCGSLRVERPSGETTVYPTIRILDSTAGKHLTKEVAKEMVLNGDRYRLLPMEVRQALLRFVNSKPGSVMNMSVLQEYTKTSIWKTILLLRGFLGCGILQFVFSKRWRVDYGLDLTRSSLAVPFRAKDVPTLRADFGHPDVAIALTCLSYYYGGLVDDRLMLSFQLLLKLDNPALEYEKWVRVSDQTGQVPPSLKDITGINIEDQEQYKKDLIPLFSKNYAVIDFYLSNIVFPRESKQFSKRLATSAWDLAEKKTGVTTGFSGTNDNRYLLPTGIDQRDLVNQGGTNAKVLGFLLRPENDHYFCLHREDSSLSSKDILKHVVKQVPSVRVLLDVGAQMLDLQSPQIAEEWILLTSDIEAVVFFNNKDQLVVMSRVGCGHVEPLESSQFNQKLDVCGIYLDDAHTRGTDLNLPKHFRAAVTLGPRVTKDRLVQGCMRMRKLGYGQSLIFLAPQEVDKNIRSLAGLDSQQKVHSLDIIRWVMVETCDYIQHHLAHWAEQGVEYKKRHEAWVNYEARTHSENALRKLKVSWEERDSRTLEEMYEITSSSHKQHPAFNIPELRERLKENGIRSLGNVKIDEEQEREVSHEIEKERQVERPAEVRPATHSVHKHLRQLVKDGTIQPDSPAFMSLFSSLEHLGMHKWSKNLLATVDFATTIFGARSSATDFQRPVNWLLSVKRKEHIVLVAISPYEANELFPLIQKSAFVHLHIYSPRVTERMKSFEDLRFFCIPPLPESWSPPSVTDIAQLNLFAGQLYIKDYTSYSHLCMVLGLVREENSGNQESRQEQWWESDGFVKPENRRGTMKEICKLTGSPLPFLKDVMGLRRKGMSYRSTHIGKLLDGGRLTREDFSESPYG